MATTLMLGNHNLITSIKNFTLSATSPVNSMSSSILGDINICLWSYRRLQYLPLLFSENILSGNRRSVPNPSTVLSSLLGLQQSLPESVYFLKQPLNQILDASSENGS